MTRRTIGLSLLLAVTPLHAVSLVNQEAFNVIQHRNEELTSQVASLNTRVEELETRIATLEAPPEKAAEAVTPAPSTESTDDASPHIEVINASSNPALMPQVLGQLEQLGANVMNVQRQATTTEKKTWILYREGFGAEAVSLGEKLEGIQIVVRRSMKEGVDIQVVVGNE